MSAMHRSEAKGWFNAPAEASRSMAWMGKPQALFEVFSDHFKFKDWIIPFNEVRAAVLVDCDAVTFSKGWILIVETDAARYQFALTNDWVATRFNAIPMEIGPSLNGSGLTLKRIMLVGAIVSLFLFCCVLNIIAEMN